MAKRNRKFTPPPLAPSEATPKKARELTAWQIFFISLGISALFIGALLTTGELLWGSGTDIHTYQFPHRDFAFSWLREGIWPLWNPYIFSGVPFQTGVHPLHYPFTILGLIFSTGLEIKLTVWLHLTIALTFTVLFLRLFKIKTVPAFLGGISYALSGFAFSHLYAGHIDIIISAAYLPVMMYFFELSLREKHLFWTILAGLIMALTLFTGHYQIIYMIILLMGTLAMLRTLLGSNIAISQLSIKGQLTSAPEIRESPQEDAAALPLLAPAVPGKTRLFEALYALERLVIIGLLSGGVALFQLLPMSEASALANRSVVKDLAFATSFGTPKLNWLTYLAPDIFGGTANLPFFAGWSAWEGQGYFGIIALLLLIVAIAILPWRYHLPLIIAIIFTTLLAMGSGTPFFKIYFAIDPMIGRFRAPSRFVMLTAFCGAWVAAITLNYFIKAKLFAKNKKPLFITLGTVILLFLGFILFLLANKSAPTGENFVRLFVSPRSLGRFNGANIPEAIISFMSGQLFISFIFILGAAAALIAGLYLPKYRYILAILLLLLSGIDLAIYAQPKLTTQPEKAFGFSDKLVNYLNANNKNQARIMTSPGLKAVNNGAAHGIAHDGGYDTLIEADYNTMANMAMGYDKNRQLMLMTLFNYGPFWQNQSVAWLLSDVPINRYSARQSQLFSRYFTLKEKVDGYYVYHNPDVLPRAYISHKVEKVASAEDLYSRLVKERITPEKVYLTPEDSQKFSFDLNELSNAEPDSAEEVKITSLTPNRAVLTANLKSSGLIIMSDSPFPGWQVAVNGQKADLLSINGGLHRAVLVPAGSHQIVFNFWPASLTIGLIVSLLTLLLAIICLVFWALKAKQAPKTT